MIIDRQILKKGVWDSYHPFNYAILKIEFWVICHSLIMSFTYYVIKNEDLYGKLKNDGSMIDYVYGPEPSKI